VKEKGDSRHPRQLKPIHAIRFDLTLGQNSPKRYSDEPSLPHSIPGLQVNFCDVQVGESLLLAGG